MPTLGRFYPSIKISELPDKVVRAKAKQGRMKHVDFSITNYTVPTVIYKLSNNSPLAPFYIYVNKGLYYQMIAYANSGQKFSNRPFKIEDVMPALWSKFYYYVFGFIR